MKSENIEVFRDLKITPNENLSELISLAEEQFSSLADNEFVKEKYLVQPSNNYVTEFAKYYNEYLNYRNLSLPKKFNFLHMSDEQYSYGLNMKMAKHKNMGVKRKRFEVNKYLIGFILNATRGYHLIVDLKFMKLLKSSLSCLRENDICGAGTIARSALETALRFYIFANKIKYIEIIPHSKRDLEELSLHLAELEGLIKDYTFSTKTFFHETYDEDMKKPLKAHQIFKDIKLADKEFKQKDGHKELIQNRYKVLCDLAHANFMGNFAYVEGTPPTRVSQKMIFDDNCSISPLQIQFILNIIFTLSFSQMLMTEMPNRFIPKFNKLAKAFNFGSYKEFKYSQKYSG
jgi:hypothetical protein